MKTLPRKMTYGEAYDPVITITTVEEADEYLEALVERDIKYFGKSRDESLRLERSNLGYWAGYCDDDTRRRVERLFNCAHPVFGAISEGIPTPSPKEAFSAGLELGKRLFSSQKESSAN